MVDHKKYGTGDFLTMSNPSKRDAHSPAMGDELQTKRRNIHDDPPLPVLLDEISEESSQSDAEGETLTNPDDRPLATLTTDEKVDCLIGRKPSITTSMRQQRES